MAAPGSSFVNSTALGTNLGLRPLVTLTEESPWEVDPGAYLGKLFLVLRYSVKIYFEKEKLKCFKIQYQDLSHVRLFVSCEYSRIF